MNYKFKILGEKILVKLLHDNQKKDSFLLPQPQNEKYLKGEVIKVGTGKYVNGILQNLQVKEKDIILFTSFHDDSFKIDTLHDNNDLRLINENQVILIYDNN